MIVALAIETGTVPDEWQRQDVVDIVTAIDVLEEIRREQNQKGGD